MVSACVGRGTFISSDLLSFLVKLKSLLLGIRIPSIAVGGASSFKERAPRFRAVRHGRQN